jgi:hypothetical protein
VPLHGPDGDEEPVGDGRVVRTGRHLRQHVALARDEMAEGSSGARAGGEHRLDDLRIDHRATTGDRSYGVGQLARLRDTVLQRVGAARYAILKQGVRVSRVVVLAPADVPRRRARWSQRLSWPGHPLRTRAAADHQGSVGPDGRPLGRRADRAGRRTVVIDQVLSHVGPLRDQIMSAKPAVPVTV